MAFSGQFTVLLMAVNVLLVCRCSIMDDMPVKSGFLLAIFVFHLDNLQVTNGYLPAFRKKVTILVLLPGL